MGSNTSIPVDTPASTQLISGLAVLLVVFIVLLIAEYAYFATNSAYTRFHTLIGYTATPTNGPLVIRQNASLYPDADPLGLSVNERTGIEFSYSFYLRVLQDTFDNSDTVKHVFHKGYSSVWPLMGPGVFIKGDTNTMRVFMSTFANPYTYLDVKNIPVGKWFHVVINSYKKGIDVFINGNLANRMQFAHTLPYQNFGDVTLFANIRNVYKQVNTPAITDSEFNINGAFSGYLSNLRYARYALSTSEINALVAEGPSNTLQSVSVDTPPYLADDWWSNQTR